MNIKESRWEQ